MKSTQTDKFTTQIPFAKEDFNAFLANTSSSFPSKKRTNKVLQASFLETPLGEMLAIADEQHLYFLGFTDYSDLKRQIEQLWTKTQATLALGETPPIASIKNELKHYFNGTLKQFKTPIKTLGTPFQQQVWEELQKIPYGETRSYREIAVAVGKPTGFRAVARANATNRLVIIIPCHRVINANGAIGGYGGGIPRKESMLRLEGATGWASHCE